MDEKSMEQKRFLGNNVPAEAVRQGTAYLNRIPSPPGLPRKMGKSPKK